MLELEARQVAPTRKGAIGRIVDRPQKECTHFANYAIHRGLAFGYCGRFGEKGAAGGWWVIGCLSRPLEFKAMYRLERSQGI